MSPLALAVLLAAPALAGTARVELVPVRTETAPTVTALPAGGLLAPLSPALASPLAPTLGAAAAPALAAPVPLLAQAAAAKPDLANASPSAAQALRGAGTELARSAAAGADAAPVLGALFDQGAARSPGAEVAAEPAAPSGARLERATPREKTRRKMPEGVKRAFQNSAVLGGGMAALFGGLYAAVQSIAPQATLPQFALLALPVALIPLHFALVSAFWAGRYYAYPKLGAAGQTAFRRAWTALSLAYPLAAVAALGWWTQLMAGQPLLLLTMSLPLLVAAAEVFHHFIYRVQAERAQDKKKSIYDWRDRLGGNIGAQLRRMRAKSP